MIVVLKLMLGILVSAMFDGKFAVIPQSRAIAGRGQVPVWLSSGLLLHIVKRLSLAILLPQQTGTQF